MSRHRLGCVLLLSLTLLFQNEIVLKGKKLLSSLQVWDVSVINKISSPITASSLPQIRRTDLFQDDLWHENKPTKECWQVENICHSSHRWFYDSRSPKPGRQPPFSLHLYGKKLSHQLNYNMQSNSSTTMFLGRPGTLVVKPLSNNLSGYHSNGEMEEITSSFLQTCQYSPISNHLVLQTYFNEMLGEFYGRSLTHLYYIQTSMTKATQTSLMDNSSISSEAISWFMEQTQIYLHVRTFTQHTKLLDSHHLFTDAFRSNPLLSFTSLLDYTGCRCMKRLILCGYKAINGHQVGKIRGLFSNSSILTELEPAPKPLYSEQHDSFPHRDVRNTLLRVVVSSNPFLQKDIADFRAAAIAQLRPELTNMTRNQTHGYRVVGLTQRVGRRRWLNLRDIIRRCNKLWFDGTNKVVCVEINIEQDDVNPVRQVVIHAACDMLIGIHGAQLTEAIWMKDKSSVVELLPWIPDGARHGAWTRWTHTPTPLGVLFSECPLNHIGYRLQRTSAPYCLNETDPADLKKCFRLNLWNDRDFQVGPHLVHDMITKFAPKYNREALGAAVPTCAELQQRAGNDYVLYNVYCTSDDVNNATPSVHHFYWARNKSRTKRGADLEP